MGISPSNRQVKIDETVQGFVARFPNADETVLKETIVKWADGNVFDNIAVIHDSDTDFSPYYDMIEEIGMRCGVDMELENDDCEACYDLIVNS